MSLLASGVAVISAQDPESGKPRGMTANALMSVSLEPPLIVVSVRRRARLHAALQAAGGYGVTVLGEGQEVQARRFLRRSPSDSASRSWTAAWPGS